MSDTAKTAWQIGDRVFIRNRNGLFEYRAERTKSFTRADGSTGDLMIFSGECEVCGEAFEQTAAMTTLPGTRRCVTHRRKYAKAAE